MLRKYLLTIKEMKNLSYDGFAKFVARFAYPEEDKFHPENFRKALMGKRDKKGKLIGFTDEMLKVLVRVPEVDFTFEELKILNASQKALNAFAKELNLPFPYDDTELLVNVLLSRLSLPELQEILCAQFPQSVLEANVPGLNNAEEP